MVPGLNVVISKFVGCFGENPVGVLVVLSEKERGEIGVEKKYLRGSECRGCGWCYKLCQWLFCRACYVLLWSKKSRDFCGFL